MQMHRPNFTPLHSGKSELHMGCRYGKEELGEPTERNRRIPLRIPRYTSARSRLQRSLYSSPPDCKCKHVIELNKISKKAYKYERDSPPWWWSIIYNDIMRRYFVYSRRLPSYLYDPRVRSICGFCLFLVAWVETCGSPLTYSPPLLM
jgi:hypothetical protein